MDLSPNDFAILVKDNAKSWTIELEGIHYRERLFPSLFVVMVNALGRLIGRVVVYGLVEGDKDKVRVSHLQFPNDTRLRVSQLKFLDATILISSIKEECVHHFILIIKL